MPGSYADMSNPDVFKATKPFAEESLVQSWLHALVATVVLAGFVTLALTFPNRWFALLASVLAGLSIVRLFCIYHDQQHGTILKNSRLGDGFMWLAGVLFLSPSSVWRSSHNFHHGHNSRLGTSYIGSYPVLTVQQWQAASRSERFAYRFARHPLTICLAYPIGFMFGMCIRPAITQPRKHWDGWVAVVLHAVIGIGLWWFGGPMAWVLGQVVPHLVACAVGAYLFYVQHNFASVVYFPKKDWDYFRAAMESSSFLRTGPIMRWFTANIGYHHIHHLNAKIPFYRLPEAMRGIPELASPKETSLSLIEIIRCCRLGLWDEETGKMVGYSPAPMAPSTASLSSTAVNAVN